MDDECPYYVKLLKKKANESGNKNVKWVFFSIHYVLAISILLALVVSFVASSEAVLRICNY